MDSMTHTEIRSERTSHPSSIAAVVVIKLIFRALGCQSVSEEVTYHRIDVLHSNCHLLALKRYRRVCLSLWGSVVSA